MCAARFCLFPPRWSGKHKAQEDRRKQDNCDDRKRDRKDPRRLWIPQGKPNKRNCNVNQYKACCPQAAIPPNRIATQSANDQTDNRWLIEQQRSQKTCNWGDADKIFQVNQQKVTNYRGKYQNNAPRCPVKRALPIRFHGNPLLCTPGPGEAGRYPSRLLQFLLFWKRDRAYLKKLKILTFSTNTDCFSVKNTWNPKEFQRAFDLNQSRLCEIFVIFLVFR